MPIFQRRKDKQKDQSPKQTSIVRTLSNLSKASDDFINGDIGVTESPLGTSATLKPDGNNLEPCVVLNSSRLSKTIHEVLHDRNAVSYFMQYLQIIGSADLLQFWLDTQSFHAQALSRLRTVNHYSLSPHRTDPHECIKNKQQECTNNTTEGPSLPPADVPNHNNNNVPFKEIRNLSVVCARRDWSTDDAITDHNEKTGRQTCTFYDESDNNAINSIETGSASLDTTTSLYVNQNLQEADSSIYPERLKYRSDSDAHPDLGTISCHSQLPNGSFGSSPTCDCDLGTFQNTAADDTIVNKLRKSITKDAVDIYTKYISPDGPCNVGLPDRLRNDVVGRICQEDGTVDVTCFTKCQDYLVELFKTNYLESFQKSAQHSRHQIDILTGGNVYLGDFLYNETAMFYFMEFIDKEGGSHLLQFVLSADNFQQLVQKSAEGYTGDQAQDDAMVLYDKYFSLQATCPLGFTDEVRFAVESNICRQGGPLPDCFAVARNIALQHMDKTYFQSFLQSDTYNKYITELTSSTEIQEDTIINYQKHRRIGSETSSEYSVGSDGRNSLLASGTRKSHKLELRSIKDVNIDESYLNPDQLWKRTSARPLKLGQLDSMGCFTSFIQPEPDAAIKNKGSGFFRKTSQKIKEEEDMALKIAQMIVTDVTCITQGDTKNPE